MVSATADRVAASTRRAALEAVARGAAALDARPAFPEAALDALERAGLLAMSVPHLGRRSTPISSEWALVRDVARADGSVGRIVDGHLNAVERIAALAPEPLRARELAAVAAGARRLGVWGADPRPGDDPPARLLGTGDRVVIRGVKVFCSGAGGLDHALVTARLDGWAEPALAYVDLRRDVEVDRSWYRAAGLRASESHRVVFRDARVLAILGGPGELTREPLFGRDAIRTAATWAGLAEAVAGAALDELAGRSPVSDLEALAAGRILGALTVVDALMGDAARHADAHPGAHLGARSVTVRAGISTACRRIAAEAADACGSRPLARGGTLDRGRRDLDVLLLQHRLDPLVTRLGREALESRE